MRSLNNFQVQPDYLMNMLAANDTRRAPSLASQFMDMFDASKLDTSLLRKRDFQSQDNLFQQELQKKLKTSMVAPDFTRPSPLQLPTFHPMLYTGRSYSVNPLMNPLGQDQGFGSLADQLKQLQSLNLLKQQQEALQNLQPLSFPNKPLMRVKNDKVYMKEEYVKQEELPTTQGSPSSYPFKSTMSDNHTVNDRLSEDSPASTELQMPEPLGEPALVAFTREFPEWDLATIFNYIKSGKSREVFEKEKQFKMERKLRRQKIKQANKEKAAALKLKKIKSKANKTIEEPDSIQE